MSHWHRRALLSSLPLSHSFSPFLHRQALQLCLVHFALSLSLAQCPFSFVHQRGVPSESCAALVRESFSMTCLSSAGHFLQWEHISLGRVFELISDLQSLSQSLHKDWVLSVA
ncbi:hypothetical protein MHYP_G00235370 [Metynnis hypsauchen]